MDERRLKRLLRVRELQLGLTQSSEAAARMKVASEQALHGRIAGLAAAVAPTASADQGFSMVAAAHFRDRLQQSAAAADARVRIAEEQLDRAAAATREAKRDQTAIEKLMARAEQDAALKAIRELEAAPLTRKVRHGPC